MERSSVIGASFQSPRSNLKGFAPSTPVTPFEALVVPRLGGHVVGRPHVSEGTAVSPWRGGSRALFSDNVSRIETALKQPINSVRRRRWAVFHPRPRGPISSDFRKLLLRPGTVSRAESTNRRVTNQAV